MKLFRTLAWGLFLLALGAWFVPQVRAEPAPAHAAEHGDHAAHGGDGDTNPLAISGDLAVWTFVIFLVLMVVLRKFAWGPIAQALDLRERTIADNIAFAEKGQEDAKQLLARYEAKLAGAQDEVRAIVEEGRRNAERLHHEILAKAKEEAQAEMTRAKREIESAKDQALVSLSEASATLAVDLAGKILGSKLNQADHTGLIEKALAGFPAGNPGKN